MTLVFAFLAGVFSTLSPCVLPILPLVVAAAISKHRFGPLALAAGLASSFVAAGLLVATAGFALGLDGGVLRQVGALMMIAVGSVLVLPQLEARFALAAGPVGNWSEQHFGSRVGEGLGGQFGVGLLLGVVWSPCVGPTLGAASLLAAQGRDLGRVAATMVLFGIGAAVPLLALGLVSRSATQRWRGILLRAGRGGKRAFGGILIAFGLLLLTDLDKSLQTALVNLSPEWLTTLTTRF